MNHAFSAFPLDFALRQKLSSDRASVEQLPASTDVSAVQTPDVKKPGRELMMSSQTTCVPQNDGSLQLNSKDELPEGDVGSSSSLGSTSAAIGTDTKAQTTPTFVESIQQAHSKIEEDFEDYDRALQNRVTKDLEISEFGWDDLEADYRIEIDHIASREIELMKQFDARFKQFMLWMRVSDERETTRALKRLRTQSALVQDSERHLMEQQQHYDRVMEAFQGAMQLLNQR